MKPSHSKARAGAEEQVEFQATLPAAASAAAAAAPLDAPGGASQVPHKHHKNQGDLPAMCCLSSAAVEPERAPVDAVSCAANLRAATVRSSDLLLLIDFKT